MIWPHKKIKVCNDSTLIFYRFSWLPFKLCIETEPGFLDRILMEIIDSYLKRLLNAVQVHFEKFSHKMRTQIKEAGAT